MLTTDIIRFNEFDNSKRSEERKREFFADGETIAYDLDMICDSEAGPASCIFLYGLYLQVILTSLVNGL